jgi:hypothetical protein
MTVSPSPSCFPSPAGLIDWWQAEGSTVDAVGTNNGSLINGAAFAPGKVGQAFSLNGVNQYVSIPDSASLRPTNVTVEGWFSFGAKSGLQMLVAKPYGNGTLDSLNVWYDNSAGMLKACMSTITSPGPVLTVNLAPVAGAWHHVAYSFNGGAHTQALYLDGAVVASGTVTGAIAYDTHSLQLGADIENGSLAYFFSGLIDEVSLYNRALSAAEVAAIYGVGSGGKCPPAPSITSQPTNQTVIVGGTATFRVGVGGLAPLGYQWNFNGTNLAGATNATLTLTNAQPEQAGNYAVLVFNSSGGILSSNALLTVLMPATILTEPLSQLATPSCSILFSVVADGTAPLSYQWWKDGQALGGQTNASLSLSGIQPFDFGSYWVAVTNAYGAVTSSNATLALDRPPVTGLAVLQRYAWGGVKVKAADLVTNDGDLDGDLLNVLNVSSPSIAGGTVALTNDWLYYTPPVGSTNGDTFAYTVSDGHCGGTAIGLVTVQVRTDTSPSGNITIENRSDGSVLLTFSGIPDWTYRIQSTDNLAAPQWQDVATRRADLYGGYEYADWPLTNAPTRFYRSVWP